MYPKIILTAIVGLLLLPWPVLADTNDDCASFTDPSSRVSCYQQKVDAAQGQEKTLSAQIELLNSQIALTASQIALTQDKLDRLNSDISSLSGKITSIQRSLDQVSTVLLNRITKTYIAGRVDPVVYLLSSANFNDLLERLSYLQIAQKHDKTLMFQMTATKKNYDDQKNLLVDKKTQVETLKIQLASEKADLDEQNQEKQALLTVTKNDESRYQSLLAQAELELSSLASSQFTEKKTVHRGDALGIMGNTGFSTGPHLHFGVYNLSQDQADKFSYNDNTNNPLDFLRSRTVPIDSVACPQYAGDVTVGSGSWDWPLDNPRISQCFGKTSFSFAYANGFHEGLDIYSLPLSFQIIKAVQDGEAYFYHDSGNGFGNNVRVFQNDGKMTLYLHLQ